MLSMDLKRQDVTSHLLPRLQIDDANDCYSALKSEATFEDYNPDLVKEESNFASCDRDTSPFNCRRTVEFGFYDEKPTSSMQDSFNTDSSLIASQISIQNLLDSDSSGDIPTTSLQTPFNADRRPIVSKVSCLPKILARGSHLNHVDNRQEGDPLAVPSVKTRPATQGPTSVHLLTHAAEGLRIRLKPNWICLVEGEGIHTMQLSRNFEKCVQRRIFFTSCGLVQLSVHCVPIPISNFIPCLRMAKLQSEVHLSAFVDAMETIVNTVRQLEICTGVCHDKYRPFWETCKRGEVDKNPYQEARYSITLRSTQCSRLVRPRKRVCSSCDRLTDSMRKKAKCKAKQSVKSHAYPKNVASHSGKAEVKTSLMYHV